MSNPHSTFLILMVASLSLTTIALLSSNRTDELVSMLTTFVPVLVIAGLIVVVTRKYWTGLRRIG